eukprot:5936729-Alexandrium_andersonii.AAC.1
MTAITQAPTALTCIALPICLAALLLERLGLAMLTPRENWQNVPVVAWDCASMGNPMLAIISGTHSHLSFGGNHVMPLFLMITW